MFALQSCHRVLICLRVLTLMYSALKTKADAVNSGTHSGTLA
jgi:hypothetical protein